jgi:hypothetical protein
MPKTYRWLSPQRSQVSKDSAGSWLEAAYDPDSGKQTGTSLSRLDHRPADQRFDAAKKLADAWFEYSM